LHSNKKYLTKIWTLFFNIINKFSNKELKLQPKKKLKTQKEIYFFAPLAAGLAAAGALP
jgi:hypothetical protein